MMAHTPHCDAHTAELAGAVNRADNTERVAPEGDFFVGLEGTYAVYCLPALHWARALHLATCTASVSFIPV